MTSALRSGVRAPQPAHPARTHAVPRHLSAGSPLTQRCLLLAGDNLDESDEGDATARGWDEDEEGGDADAVSDHERPPQPEHIFERFLAGASFWNAPGAPAPNGVRHVVSWQSGVQRETGGCFCSCPRLRTGPRCMGTYLTAYVWCVAAGRMRSSTKGPRPEDARGVIAIGGRGVARALTKTRAKEKKKALHARLLAQDEAKGARGNAAAYLATKRQLLKSDGAEAGVTATATPAAAPVSVGCEDAHGAGQAADHGRVWQQVESTAVAPLTTGDTEGRRAELCSPSSQRGVAAEASGAPPAATAVETEEEGPTPAGMNTLEQVEQWHGPHHPLTHQACQREADEMAGLASNASAGELAAAAEQSVRVLMQAVVLQPGDGDLWWRCGLLLERDLRDLAGAEEKYRTGASSSLLPPPWPLPFAELDPVLHAGSSM